jgi:hypothetical protein
MSGEAELAWQKPVDLPDPELPISAMRMVPAF